MTECTKNHDEKNTDDRICNRVILKKVSGNGYYIRIFTDNNSGQFGNYMTDFGKKGPHFSLGMWPKFGSKIRGAKTLPPLSLSLPSPPLSFLSPTPCLPPSPFLFSHLSLLLSPPLHLSISLSFPPYPSLSLHSPSFSLPPYLSLLSLPTSLVLGVIL